MGVGRARESERTYLTSRPKVRQVDPDRAPPTRRRPVRVRRRRSQRRAEKGEKSEGGKCDGSIGSTVRMAPLSQVGSGCEGPQTVEPIDRFSLRPSHAHNVRRHHRRERVRWSARCSLGVERGGCGYREGLRDCAAIPPVWRPLRRSARGTSKCRSEFRSSEALRKIGAMAYALRHADHRISQVSHHCVAKADVGVGVQWAIRRVV